MAIIHTNTAGTAPGTLAADGETYTGFGYLIGGTGSDSFVINNNSTLNAWLGPMTGDDSVLLDSGGVVAQYIQGQTFNYENTIYEVYNNSVEGLAPRQTSVSLYMNTGDSNDTVTIDGSGYTGTDDYAISIGAGGTFADVLSTQNGNDDITISNSVNIAGGVNIGAGSDTVSIGNDVLIDGDISSAGNDNGADTVTIANGATVTGGIRLTSGNDTVNIAGNLGDGAADQIELGEGENSLTIASTVVVDIGQITMGSTTGSNLTIEEGAQVKLISGSFTGTAFQLTQGNDNLFLGGTYDSSYDQDVHDGYATDDSITLGSDFSAVNTGPSSVFKISGGGNAIAVDNDTLDISAIYSRIVSNTPDPENAENGRLVLDDGTVIEYTEIENIITCFTSGTMIETDRGTVAIENLQAGDLFWTQDNGLQPIRWIGSRKLSATEVSAAPKLRPIRIRKGALGDNVPSEDLIVSPQHRILVRSKIAQRMFGTDEVLVGAKHLLQIDGVEFAEELASVEYFHMLFDQHEVVFSNGAATESFYTGEQAMKALSPAAREEVFTLFPELRGRNPDELPPSARPLVAGRMGRQLAQRHYKNGHALV